ncbi:Uncharacterized protein Fot_40123 [Forsythia ovata]|uniref:Uncharacterized protein n=1 Tax=Forsythia ovata TaxID=205694 RepID=A0ABD1S7C4_9LAMI
MVSEGLFFIYKSLGTRRGNNPSKNSQSSSPSSKPTKFIFQKFSPIMFIQIQASFRPKLQEILAKKFLNPRSSKKLGRTYLLGQQNQQNLGAESEQTGGQRRDQNQQAGFESQAVTGTVFGVQISAKSAPGVSRKWPKQAPDLGEISAIWSRGHRKNNRWLIFLGREVVGQ